MTPAYLVCATTGYFGDDVAAHCATCGAPIVHRPHVNPDLVQICVRCAVDRVASSLTPPEVRITEETRNEVALFLTPPKGTH